MTAEVCEPLQKLTAVKAERIWNGMYQDLCDRTKKLVNRHACMKFYFTSRSIYLETDASGFSLEAGLLQARDGMNCEYINVECSFSLYQIIDVYLLISTNRIAF